MFDCGQDEQTFWRTMTPARLHVLFSAYFRRHEPAEQPKEPAEQPSLMAYFQGRC